MLPLDLARSPTTSPAQLRELARDGSLEVRQQVALNPATPADALLSLCSGCGPQVLANPALPLLLFESPLLFCQLEPEAAQSLLQHPLPEAVQLSLLRYPNESIRRQTAFFQPLSTAAYEHVLQDSDERMRITLAANPACPDDVLARLLDDPVWQVRARALRHPRCPVAILERCARHELSFVRSEVAANPACPEELRALLACDPSERVRTSRPETPDELRRQFIPRLRLVSTSRRKP